jgi:hypothetical protein
MQPRSIAVYVSLLHLLDIIRKNEATEEYECILTEPPTREGMEELITRTTIERLTAEGFTREVLTRLMRRFFRPTKLMLPTLRSIYQELSMEMPEVHFLQLSEIGGVRRYFGFALVTRRLLIPTGEPAA